MPKHAGEHGCDLDHPRDRPPEEARQTFERADMMFHERIFTILSKPPRRLGLGEARGIIHFGR